MSNYTHYWLKEKLLLKSCNKENRI